MAERFVLGRVAHSSEPGAQRAVQLFQKTQLPVILDYDVQMGLLKQGEPFLIRKKNKDKDGQKDSTRVCGWGCKFSWSNNSRRYTVFKVYENGSIEFIGKNGKGRAVIRENVWNIPAARIDSDLETVFKSPFDSKRG